jgi:hypothetical protein
MSQKAVSDRKLKKVYLGISWGVFCISKNYDLICGNKFVSPTSSLDIDREFLPILQRFHASCKPDAIHFHPVKSE